MNTLLEKYNDYKRLVGCTVEYKLSNGTVIEAKYKLENFPHLIGLHKLRDVQLVQFWQDRSNTKVKLPDVLRHIRNETFTDANIRASVFFNSIRDRYDNFSYDNLTTLNYTDAIIDFDPTIINSRLRSDYILFEERPASQYNHMGIATDTNTGNKYVETFFHEDTNNYIVGQTIVKVESFRIIDSSGNIIVKDQL